MARESRLKHFYSGSVLRACFLVFLIVVLGITSEHDTGDRLTCTGCIILFGSYMLAEQIAPLQTLCFMLLALVWGFILQPAFLNRCHLTMWLLIFGAFRNSIAQESHATAEWRYATMTDVYQFFWTSGV
jgi:hypothetical protein